MQPEIVQFEQCQIYSTGPSLPGPIGRGTITLCNVYTVDMCTMHYIVFNCCVCVNAQVHLLINYTRILLRQALSVGMYRVAQKVAKLSMQTFQIKSNGLGCTFYVAAKNSLQISSVLLYPRNAVSNSSADDTSATAMSNIMQY